MDVDNIFGLFGFNKNNDNEVSQSQEETDLFKSTPIFKVGMFKKLIWNGMNFRDQVIEFLQKSNSELEVIDGDLGSVGDMMMHTRAYIWIQGCNLEDNEWEDALNHYNDDELIVCFKLIIKYFEEIEEFEKCAYLKKIQTFVEKQNVLNLIKKA